MKHELYSELRTIYEATAENPRTFRITIKLKDMVDEEVLVRAVAAAMERYPYFRMRLVVDGGEVFFEDNPAPVPVLHADGPITLASPQVDGHLLAFCWWKNKVHIDGWHALTDGGGLYHLIQTLLYLYCSEYYGRELSCDGIWLAGDEIAQAEWDDPARTPISVEPLLRVPNLPARAFQIADGGIARITPDCIAYNIRINEAEFMRFNLSKEGSPATVVALFLSRAIASLHPATDDPIAIALCVNQRRALAAPLAHQSLVGTADLVYGSRMASKGFDVQETCFRGMVAIQTDASMVLQEVRAYQDLMARLAELPTIDERRALCQRLSEEKTARFTATVSYVGKSGFGDAEFYVQEFHALPSTALPSCATPLTLELSAVNGSFYVNFMQFFREDDYLRAFIMQLRENGIDYDVLYQEAAKYPALALPW